MDERTKKEEDIYLGVYHPHPKEAPKSWRMARMKQLRKEGKLHFGYNKVRERWIKAAEKKISK